MIAAVTETETEARSTDDDWQPGDPAPEAPPAATAVTRRQRTARGPLPQPRAELAGLQRPGAGAGRRHVTAAAGTGEVPGDLRLQPRRVLHGPGRRPEAPRRDGPVGPVGRRPVAPRATAPDRRPHPADLAAASRRCSSTRCGPALAEEGIHIVTWAELDRRPTAPAVDVLPRAGFPGAHAAGRRPGTPVPVRQRAEPEPGRHRASSRGRRRALRPSQGARQRRPVRRARRAPATTSRSRVPARWRN